MGNHCATTAAIHLRANDHGAMIDLSSEQSKVGIFIRRCGHYGIIIAGWLKRPLDEQDIWRLADRERMLPGIFRRNLSRL